MAEALLRDLLTRYGKGNYKIKSAGISAFEGGDAAYQAIRVMKEEGIDLSNHQTTLLSQQLIEESDLILTMTQRHKLVILDDYPDSREKVYTLKEYAARVEDIENETKQIEELHQIIDKKREEFILEYQDEIEELEDKREELLSELEGIEGRIAELEDELNQRVLAEKRELARLKERIGNLDISDPFGQPISIYRDCAQEIKAELEKIVENLE
jgi:protein-tyrosine phosphatase